jgi:hypothetical protein
VHRPWSIHGLRSYPLRVCRHRLPQTAAVSFFQLLERHNCQKVIPRNVKRYCKMRFQGVINASVHRLHVEVRFAIA